MKKLLFPALAILAFGFTTQAQDVKFGVKAGYNLSSFTGDGADGIENLSGCSAGLVAEVKISDRFSVQPELLYSMQGAKGSFTGFVDPTIFAQADLTTRVNYIAIPVMAKVYAAKGFSIEAGPQVSFLVAAKNKVEGTFTDMTSGFSQNVNSTQDAKKMYKGTDFGVNVGAGYQFDNGIFLQARYNVGLTEIGEEYSEDGTSYEAAKVKNSVFAFSLGYSFK
ncbi:hypothetical protein VF13_40140 [Nostoc linckia z16]|nr:hypothetical protein VF13_40140 [Nostoc linckia z16]